MVTLQLPQRLIGVSSRKDVSKLRSPDEVKPSVSSRRPIEDTASKVSTAILRDRKNTKVRDIADKTETDRLTIRISRSNVQENTEIVLDPRARGNRGIRTSGHKVEEAALWASPVASMTAVTSKSSKETVRKSDRCRNDRRKQMKRQLRQLLAASDKVTNFCRALLYQRPLRQAAAF